MQQINDATKQSVLRATIEWQKLTMEQLVAIGGHLIGVSDNMTVAVFNDLVREKSSALMDDKTSAVRFFKECVAARFILKANYLILKKRIPPVTKLNRHEETIVSSGEASTTETDDDEPEQGDGGVPLAEVADDDD